MITGRYFISTGFLRHRNGGFWHLLVAFRWGWRFAFIRPSSKPHYRRLYIGPVEIEWSCA